MSPNTTRKCPQRALTESIRCKLGYTKKPPEGHIQDSRSQRQDNNTHTGRAQHARHILEADQPNQARSQLNIMKQRTRSETNRKIHRNRVCETTIPQAMDTRTQHGSGEGWEGGSRRPRIATPVPLRTDQKCTRLQVESRGNRWLRPTCHTTVVRRNDSITPVATAGGSSNSERAAVTYQAKRHNTTAIKRVGHATRSPAECTSTTAIAAFGLIMADQRTIIISLPDEMRDVSRNTCPRAAGRYHTKTRFYGDRRRRFSAIAIKSTST